MISIISFQMSKLVIYALQEVAVNFNIVGNYCNYCYGHYIK